MLDFDMDLEIADGDKQDPEKQHWPQEPSDQVHQLVH